MSSRYHVDGFLYRELLAQLYIGGHQFLDVYFAAQGIESLGEVCLQGFFAFRVSFH